MAEQPLDADQQIEAETDAGIEAEREDAQILRFPSTGRHHAPEADPRLRDLLGRVLRDERLEQHRTLADVADAANVSLPYLSEVERGLKEVSSDLLHSITEALEVPLDDVLERAVRHIRTGSTGGSGIRMLAA